MTLSLALRHHLESVEEVYQRPDDQDFPILCLDEQLKQLVQERIEPSRAKPGQQERYDYQYERAGTAVA